MGRNSCACLAVEAEFEHGLSLDGTLGEKAVAHWQNGLTERKGRVEGCFKEAHVVWPRSKQEVQQLVGNVDCSPCQHVPGLVTADYDPVINSGLGQLTVARISASWSTGHGQGEVVSSLGCFAYFGASTDLGMRINAIGTDQLWSWDAKEIQRASKVWAAQGSKVPAVVLSSCNASFLIRKATIRLLPADVVHVRREVSARGAGTFHGLVEQCGTER